MKTIEEILTNLENSSFDIKGIPTEDMPPRPHRSLSEATTNPLLVPSLLVDAKLSPETFQREVARLDKLAQKRKSLRQRKKYTRKPGTVHPKKKEATKRRRYREKWARDPFSVMISGYGAKNLDRKKWDEYIAPLWEVYLPSDLSIKKYRGVGTRERPLDIYGFDVIHRTEGKVYSGEDQLLYDLSSNV